MKDDASTAVFINFTFSHCQVTVSGVNADCGDFALAFDLAVFDFDDAFVDYNRWERSLGRAEGDLAVFKNHVSAFDPNSRVGSPAGFQTADPVVRGP